MLINLLAVAAILTAGGPPQAVAATERAIRIAVVDERGAPVSGLTADDVAVLEEGVARRVVAFEAEQRPPVVAVVVDTSEPVSGALRLQVVPAVRAFLRLLPAGSSFAVWGTGDRPTRLTEFTTSEAAAGAALERAFGRGGNVLLDTLVEATRELKRQPEGSRTILVAVTSLGAGFANYDRRSVVDRAAPGLDQFYAVSYDDARSSLGLSGGGGVTLLDYEYVLDKLAARSGGVRATTLSASGVAHALERFAADLKAQYHVRFDSASRDGRLDVQVAHPDAEVRLGVAQP